jgi:hypothetical protein
MVINMLSRQIEFYSEIRFLINVELLYGVAFPS